MKKIIALALVLVLSLSMATVAFATDVNFGTTDDFIPDSKAFLYAADFIDNGDTAANAYFTSDYFTLSYKFDKGGDKVEYVKFNNSGAIEIKFKANFELEKPAIENFKFNAITIKAKKDIAANKLGATAAAISRNDPFEVKTATVLDDKFVGYVKDSELAGDTAADNKNVDLAKTGSIKITKSGYRVFKKAAADGVDFKDITFTQNGVYLTGRVYDGDKMYLGTSTSPDIDIVKANPDVDKLDFVKFIGAPKFNSTATIEIAAEKTDFVYEIKDGKLVKSNFEWKDDVWAFVGKTRTPGAYVVSDKELKNAVAADDETKNPNTGANDVVGVAVALAVVSLVAAGAVSLKK